MFFFFFFFRIKAERRASEAKLEYEQVSKLVKTEVARFEQERIEDFKDSLHAFLEGMISRQKEVRGGWGSAYFFFCPAYFYGLVDRNMGELPTDAFEESKWRWSCGYANIRILRNFSIRMIVERLEGLPLKNI